MGSPKPSRTPKLPPGSVRLTKIAVAHYEECFLPRYKRFLEEVDETALTVLIWGPGPTGGDLYEKRLQIRDELRAIGITALFSEEVCQSVIDTAHLLSTQELAQAKASDL